MDINVGYILVGGRYVTGIQQVQENIINEIHNRYDNVHMYSLSPNPFSYPIVNRHHIINDMEIKSLNIDIATYGCNLIHSFHFPFDNCGMDIKRIITIHDLIPLVHPEWYGKGALELFDIHIRRSAEQADAIIAISNYTRNDIIKYYGIEAEKIHVIYNGVSRKPFSSTASDILSMYDIDSDYILSVCTLAKNKNIDGLISAFARFKERNPTSKTKLVLVGAPGNKKVLSEMLDVIGTIKKDVIITGYICDDYLDSLYKRATAFAYLSLYEGFGLPILEALSYGKAVICSNTSSMPEVGGNSVEYCDPYNVDSIVFALERVLLDENYRLTLEAGAQKQARQFSFEDAAKKTVELYASCLRG